MPILDSILEKITNIIHLIGRLRSRLCDLQQTNNSATLEDCVIAVENISAREAADTILDANNSSYTIPEGYHSGSGTVSIVGESRTVIPLPTERTVTPSSGKVITSFTVRPIPSSYADITVTTLTPDLALMGSTFVDSTGKKVTGSMPYKGRQIATIDGLDVTSYTIPAGYHDGQGTVSLTNAIETALAEI